MNSSLISVITTVYNGEKFIRRTIESILQQTYAHFEYIIIDDGSTDKTVNIVESIRDSRIFLWKPGRIGRGKALNLGLAKAKGEYIAIQDADDMSHPEKLEIQLKTTKEIGEDMILGTNVKRIWGEEDVNMKYVDAIRTEKINVKNVTHHIMYYNPIRHSTLFMLKESLLKINGYDQNRKNLFDYDILIRFVENGGKLFNISEFLLFRRIHKNQYYEQKNRFFYTLSAIPLQKKAIKYFKKNRIRLLVILLLIVYKTLPLKIRMFCRGILGK